MLGPQRVLLHPRLHIKVHPPSTHKKMVSAPQPTCLSVVHLFLFFFRAFGLHISFSFCLACVVSSLFSVSFICFLSFPSSYAAPVLFDYGIQLLMSLYSDVLFSARATVRDSARVTDPNGGIEPHIRSLVLYCRSLRYTVATIDVQCYTRHLERNSFPQEPLFITLFNFDLLSAGFCCISSKCLRQASLGAVS